MKQTTLDWYTMDEHEPLPHSKCLIIVESEIHFGFWDHIDQSFYGVYAMPTPVPRDQVVMWAERPEIAEVLE